MFSGLPKGTQVAVVFVMVPLSLPHNPITKTRYCGVFDLTVVGSGEGCRWKVLLAHRGEELIFGVNIWEKPRLKPGCLGLHLGPTLSHQPSC